MFGFTIQKKRVDAMASNTMMEYRLIRTFTCYSNTNDKVVFDVQIKDFDLEEFQIEFGVNTNNPMYDSYEIKAGNLPFIKQYLPESISINWDFNNYAYFIEVIEN